MQWQGKRKHGYSLSKPGKCFLLRGGCPVSEQHPLDDAYWCIEAFHCERVAGPYPRLRYTAQLGGSAVSANGLDFSDYRCAQAPFLMLVLAQHHHRYALAQHHHRYALTQQHHRHASRLQNPSDSGKVANTWRFDAEVRDKLLERTTRIVVQLAERLVGYGRGHSGSITAHQNQCKYSLHLDLLIL